MPRKIQLMVAPPQHRLNFFPEPQGHGSFRLCLAKISICRRIKYINLVSQFGLFQCRTGLMLRLLRLLVATVTRCFRPRRDLLLENLALRQQLSALKRRHSQPRPTASDKLFWVVLRRLWPGWKQALILVQPETVAGTVPGSSCTGRGSRGTRLAWEEDASAWNCASCFFAWPPKTRPGVPHAFMAS